MLRVDDLKKSYQSLRARKSRADAASGEREYAVDGVSFEVQEGELVTLLGPSGCGKTTTLRSVAGLERPDLGAIAVGGREVFSSAKRINLVPNKRRMGMVFQSYAIWPHMDVFHNVSFPLESEARGERLSAKEIKKRVDEVLDAVHLSSFRDRAATNLSGGQQQRLALARALVTRPQLVLLDEPLSNLDAKLRESMRLELKRMQRELGVTMLYVTHDQQEALALSSTIVVMNDGKVVQRGTPREIYSKPNSRFVAEFIGASNFLTGTVAAVDGGRVCVRTSSGDIWSESNPGLGAGSAALVSIRPEDFEIDVTRSSDPIANEWEGRLTTSAFLGEVLDHVVQVGEAELRCRVNPSVSIRSGSTVYLRVAPERVQVLPA